MTVERQITRGNVLSILTTVLGMAGVLVTVTLHVATIRSDMEIKDREHDGKIERLEKDVTVLRADHDTIIEMRQDVKAIRASLDRLDRRMTPVP